MKNTILLFLILTTIMVSGQNHQLGVRGGVGLTNVKANNFLSDRNFRTGIVIGLSYDYIYKNHFSAAANILYNQRGFSNELIFTDEDGNPTGTKEKIKFNYDYLTLPLTLGFNYGKTIYGFANIGFTPSILIDAKAIAFEGTVALREVTTILKNVNKFDIGGLVEIGGGYKFREKYWLYSSFLYQQSFTTISNADYFANSKIRHYGLTINLGLKCSLTKK